MKNFSQQIEQLLSQYAAILDQQAVVFGGIFRKERASVAEFIAEIQQTAALLKVQTEADHAELYAAKLFQQFAALKRATEKLSTKSAKTAFFHSPYRFPKNIHSLSADKRLVEYRKALRALNDKISWLVEKQLNAYVEKEKQQLQQVIQETEYRKARCLAEIEKLEEELLFKN